MLDAMLAMTDVVTNFWSLGVRPEPGKGLQVICEGFRASDGYVVVQIVREHQFAKLADLVGHPEWNDDPALRDPRRLGAEPRDGDPPRGRGVGVAPHQARGGARAHRRRHRRRAEQPAADLIADPHVATRNMLVEMPPTPTAGADPVLIPGNPVKLSKVAEGPETRVPWVGEHTDDGAAATSSASTDDDHRRAARRAASSPDAN